jgi:hypothetical protein
MGVRKFRVDCRTSGTMLYGPASGFRLTPHIEGMNLELRETVALIRALSQIIENDRYPLSPRTRVLKEILGLLRPEPERPPLPPLKVYAPPWKGRYKRG